MEIETPNTQQQRSQVMSRPSSSKTSSPSKMQFFKAKSAQKAQTISSPFRNPYLNFLREFRKRNVGLSAVETVRRGAKEWRTLPKDKKLKYIEAAFYAPKRRKPLGRQTSMYSEVGNPEDCGCKPKKRSTCPKKSIHIKKGKKSKKNKCGKKRRPKKPKRKGCKKRPRRRKKKKC